MTKRELILALLDNDLPLDAEVMYDDGETPWFPRGVASVESSKYGEAVLR